TLPAPRASPTPPPVERFHSCVWEAPAVAGAAFPSVASVSRTIPPSALIPRTDGDVLVPDVERNVPKGTNWLTPVKDMALATTGTGPERVTTTFAVPADGFTSCHMSMRFELPPPFWAPI